MRWNYSQFVYDLPLAVAYLPDAPDIATMRRMATETHLVYGFVEAETQPEALRLAWTAARAQVTGLRINAGLDDLHVKQVGERRYEREEH